MRLELADRHLVRDSARDRRRLARARTGEDAHRAAHGLDGAPLLGIQPGEDGIAVHPCTVETARDGDCAELVESVFQNGGAGPLGLPQHPGQPRDDVERLAPFHHPFELVEPFLEPFRVDGRPRGAEDLRVRCRPDLLAVGPELLVQLLARADADERDRDVRLRILAREADHVDGQVEDLHRLAHVEHVDLAAAADRAGLHDERHRLRDGHEVARHLRMSHRHRTALLDLAAEDRDHAAGGVEDVAEANGDEARGDVLAVAVGLDDPLAQCLRLSEEVLRVRGLVRRDEHEPLRPVLDRDVRHDSRCERVVADCLERVGLQQGDVLVSGGMEDDARLVALEDLTHLGAVAAVSEHGRDRREVALAHELALDVEERRLRVLDEHEPRRPDPRDLAAELGADRAARAGDEDGLAGEVLRDRAHVDLDRLAAEHVLHLNRPDLPREIEIAGDQLVQPRQRLHRERSQPGRSRPPAGVSRPKRTGSRSAPRPVGCRAGCAAGRRSCRARGCRAGGCSSCADRRR